MWPNKTAARVGVEGSATGRAGGVLRSTSVGAGLAQRARIVLLAAEGVPNSEIAERVGVSRPTVNLWRARYAERGLAGLADEERPGRPRTVDRVEDHRGDVDAAADESGGDALVVAAAGATGWGSTTSTIAEAWKEYGVKPWKAETFKFSTDPELEAKVTDVDRAVPGAAGERDRAVCGREVPDPGVEPDPEDAADAARSCRAAHPRLRPARHHHLVRRAGDRHREGHRAVQEPAPTPGVPGLPQARRPRLPRRRAAPGDGQLRHPQTRRGARPGWRRTRGSTSTSPRPPGRG